MKKTTKKFKKKKMRARAIGDFFSGKTKRCKKDIYLSWSKSTLKKVSEVQKKVKKNNVSKYESGIKVHVTFFFLKSACWRQRS